MGTQIVPHEPIKLPDPRRPAMLPLLPAWLARSSGAVRLELQISPQTKTFEKNEVLVLPLELMPSETQRQEMQAHIDNLRSYLRQTPAESAEAETAVATAVSKLLVVLAGERKSELSEGARADVYLDVLDDVPYWAVDAAVKLWFRHDCGTDEKGKAHDYKWAPDPGTLRKIAQRQTYDMSARIGSLQRVLEARQYVDCTAQLAEGRAAWQGLRLTLGDSEAARSLTFEEAVKIGNGSGKPAPAIPAMSTPAPPSHEAAAG